MTDNCACGGNCKCKQETERWAKLQQQRKSLGISEELLNRSAKFGEEPLSK